MTMTEKTTELLKKQDPRAAALYAILREDIGVADSSIDRGVPFVDCDIKSCRRGTKPGTRENGEIEPGEVYETAVELLEKEEDAFAASGGSEKRPFTDLVSTKTDFRVPWLFNDFDPKTTSDDEVLLSAAGAVAKTKKELSAVGKKGGTPAFNRELVKKLVSTMLSKNGFGLIPLPPKAPEETVLELLSHAPGKRAGACTELSRLAYGLFRLAGLKTTFVEVQQDYFDISENFHMAVGVKLNPEEPKNLTTVDMLYNGWISDTGHILQSEMPAVTSLAAYVTNRASFEMLNGAQKSQKTEKRLEALFNEAIGFDSSFSIARYSFAYFYEEWQNDLESAGKEAAEAARLRPFDKLYQELERYYSEKKFTKPAKGQEK